ncbi:sulfatase family protein [Mesonia mobilis]|uniref:sulfatase family protein n=2 Tax=Mesonia mobilis TaxID=369791 RepID=UPI0026EE07D1|nr:sulfatase [Mesonia mobilis]
MKFSFNIFAFLCLTVLIGCKDNASEEKKAEKTAANQKPNIVFIMADDHAVKAISAYGSEIGKLAPTPNIDRLAKNGAIFNQNYNTNSLCGPSRAVILTGKHSHQNGFRMNGERFDNTQQTLPKILQQNGYQTAVIGKWHLSDEPTGFDYWKILDDQGKYYNPDFITAEDTTRVTGYAQDLITDYSIDWMKQRNEEQPFFLMVHHKAPHRNWMPALRHTTLYDSVEFPLPDTYFPDFENQQAAEEQLQTIYEDMYEGHDLKLSKHKGTDSLAANPWKDDFERMTAEQKEKWNAAYRPKNDAFWEKDLHGKDLAKWKGQRYLREYMATIASVDESVGRIIDYLEAQDLDENTLVVYTSDQGFYLGENGWFDKRYMYETSFRMPLLMQFPKEIEAGSVISEMTQNLDFAPTFLDMAGKENPKNMQGISFKKVLYGEEAEIGRDAIYYHYYDFPAFHMVKRQYGIKTDRYKLIHFYDDIDTWEFYDLEKDPKEQNNLIDAEEYQAEVKMMHQKLDSVQQHYQVTEKEFETTPKEKVDQAYKNFERLRGTPIK